MIPAHRWRAQIEVRKQFIRSSACFITTYALFFLLALLGTKNGEHLLARVRWDCAFVVLTQLKENDVWAEAEYEPNAEYPF